MGYWRRALGGWKGVEGGRGRERRKEKREGREWGRGKVVERWTGREVGMEKRRREGRGLMTWMWGRWRCSCRSIWR